MPESAFIQGYRVLLLLFPRRFRDEFSDEMLEIFSQAIEDAARVGSLAKVEAFLQELRDLPWVALKERLDRGPDREVGILSPPTSWEGALSGKGLLVAMAAFLIPLIAIMTNSAPLSSRNFLLPIGFIFIVVVLVTGLLKGAPRWCLPYFGLAISMITFHKVINGLTSAFPISFIPGSVAGAWDQSYRLLWEGFVAGMMWLSLFLGVAFVLACFSAIRHLRQFYWRIRQDWTQVSFILYGGAMTTLVLLFEDYHDEEPFALVSVICLAVGAWFYLRSPRSRQRALALVTGITLAMWVAAYGKYLIVPRQPWTLWFQVNPPETERWIEALRTLFEWGWMVFFLLAPRILRFFPPPPQPFHLKQGR